MRKIGNSIPLAHFQDQIRHCRGSFLIAMREHLALNYPRFQIIKIQPMMPVRYIFSGGLSTWVSLPEFFYPLIKRFEILFEKKMDKWGMFALIVLEKIR